MHRLLKAISVLTQSGPFNFSYAKLKDMGVHFGYLPSLMQSEKRKKARPDGVLLNPPI
jgi:hypothetical protein